MDWLKENDTITAIKTTTSEYMEIYRFTSKTIVFHASTNVIASA